MPYFRLVAILSTCFIKLIIDDKIQRTMSVFRVILSILFPPLAVIDKGCGSFLIVLILTIFVDGCPA